MGLRFSSFVLGIQQHSLADMTITCHNEENGSHMIKYVFMLTVTLYAYMPMQYMPVTTACLQFGNLVISSPVRILRRKCIYFNI